MPPARNEVWLVMPSASASNCRANLPAWREMGYRIAVLADDPSLHAPADTVVRKTEYRGYAWAINTLLREAVPPTCDLIVAAGDDMLPDPHLRAQEIHAQFLEQFRGSKFGVMQPAGDGVTSRTICGSPFIGRCFFERMYNGGGPYCEAYHHHFADDELYWVARCVGALCVRDDLTHRHLHPAFDAAAPAKGAYWSRAASQHDLRDNLTFIARAAARFPGHSPLEMRPGDATQPFNDDAFTAAYDQRAERLFATNHAHRVSPGEVKAIAPALTGQQIASLFNASPDARMRSALEHLAGEGIARVALMPGGRHSVKCARAIRASWERPTGRVVGFIDDDPACAAAASLGLPAWSLDRARGNAEAPFDAVVISSDKDPNPWAARAETLAQRGIRVVPLAADSPHRALY